MAWTTTAPVLRRAATGAPRRRALSLARCAAWLAVALAARAADAAPGDAAVVSAAPIRIRLRSEVRLEKREVVLGDVAVLETRDLATLQRLVSLPLGEAPRAGSVVRLRRDALLRWIRARTAIDGKQIEWSGSEDCDVRIAVRELSGRTIADRALEGVRSLLSRGGGRVEVSVREPPRDLNVPAGPVELELRPVPATSVVPRRLTAWVDVSVDGRFVRTVPVGLDVHVFGPGWVATRGHAAGELLERSSVEIREVEWSGLDVLPVQPDVPAPLRLRRPLAAGDTLTRAKVEPAPLVIRGEMATLRATAGLVEIESRVEVLQDGRSGQTVRVKRPNAPSAILARVTGPGAVEVM